MDKRIIKLEKYIKETGAQKLGLDNAKNISIKEINRGGYNVNYLVDIDGRKFVFRLNLDKYLDVENQTKYEYEILKHIEKSGIASRVYFIDISKKIFENDLLVEEFVENTPLHFGDKFLKDFGKLIKKLHSIPLPDNGLLIRNKEPLINQLNLINNKIGFIKSANLKKDFLDFINPYIPKVSEYVAKFSHLFSAEDICINHRDLVIENVLQTDKGLRLIDWQTAMADDPSYDLAYVTSDIVIEWSLERPITEQEKNLFLKSYGANNTLLDKIRIRQPMVHFELFVWVAYRIAYLKNKLAKSLVEENDKYSVSKRLSAYEKFLNKDRMNKYLNIFKTYARKISLSVHRR